MDRNTLYLARRYARAFFLLYGYHLDQQHGEILRSAAHNLVVHHGWKVFFLTSLTTRADQRACCAVLLQVFKLPQWTLRLLDVLLKHNRMPLLPPILKCIADLVDERDNIERFTIDISSQEVLKDVQELEKVLEKKINKRVRAHYRVRPELIAGFSAQSKYHQCQYSVRQLLNSLVCRNCT